MLWVPYYLLLLTGVYKFCHPFLSPRRSEHTATKAAQKELTRRTAVHCVRDTERIHTCSSRNCNIPLMGRANTDIAPNKPVTLHRNQLFIRYGVTSTLSRYGVTLRGNVTVWTHPPRYHLAITGTTTSYLQNIRSLQAYSFCYGLMIALYQQKPVAKNVFLKRSVGSDSRINKNKYTPVICMPTGISRI
jgi:hypothetical protein